MVEKQQRMELIAGIFIIIGILAFIVLAFKVSGLTNYASSRTYKITAEFNDIGDLKERAPVTVAGVVVGRVTNISLNAKDYKAVVTMLIDKNSNNIPVDSTANIYTAGLLGANYISITPGFEEEYLKNGETIENTNQALILQNLIGQLMFNLKGGDKKK